MAPKGVYVFFRHTERDALPPHNILYKIGGGIIPDRFKNAQKTIGTYVASHFEILIAKVTGEDWHKHENELKKAFAQYSVDQVRGSGLGIEWFRNLTPDMIMKEMEKLPGEYYQENITIDTFHKKSASDQYAAIRKQNIILRLHDRSAYELSIPDRETFIPNPDKYFECWTTWSHFLGVDTSRFPQTKTEWVSRCKEMGLKSWEEYQRKKYDDLPKNPRDMYNDYTNWDEEFGVDNDHVW